MHNMELQDNRQMQKLIIYGIESDTDELVERAAEHKLTPTAIRRLQRIIGKLQTLVPSDNV